MKYYGDNFYAEMLFCALLRPVALFCGLATCQWVCALLRSLALFWAHLRVSANDCIWQLQNYIVGKSSLGIFGLGMLVVTMV